VCPQAGDRHVCGGHVMCEGRQPTATGPDVGTSSSHPQQATKHNSGQESWNAKDETPYGNVQINAVEIVHIVHMAWRHVTHPTHATVREVPVTWNVGQGAK
jgi:hypothetical protein